MSEGFILSILSLFLLAISTSMMKWVSFRRSDLKVSYEFFYSPTLSVRTYRRASQATKDDIKTLMLRFILCWTLVWLIWPTWRSFISHHDLLCINYLAALPLVLAVYTFEATLKLAVLFGTRKSVPSLLNEPWKAKNLAEFWGHRWNTWVNDWMEQVFIKRRSAWANFAWAFVFSGIWHEYFLWAPTRILSDFSGKKDQAMPGLLLGYFLIQFIGTAIDRRMGRTNKFRRIWMWAVVIGPLPLFLNDSTLMILLLK